MARMVLTDGDELIDTVVTYVPVERARLEAAGYRRADLDRPAVGDRVGAWRDYVTEQHGVPADVTAGMNHKALVAHDEEHDDRPAALDVEPPVEDEATGDVAQPPSGDPSA